MTTPTPAPTSGDLPQNLDFPPLKMQKAEAAAAALATAGFPPDQWATGVAVGMGESGLNIAARNKSTDSVGWLQINKKAHPDLFKGLKIGYEWLDPVTNAQMAKKVYDGAHGWGPWEAYTGPDGKGSDGPWRQYQKEGQQAAETLQKNLAGKTDAQKKAYLKSLTYPYSEAAGLYILGIGTHRLAGALATGGTEAGNFVTDSGAAVADSVKDLVNEFTAISNFFQKMLLPSTWIRIGAGTVGVMLIVAGMVALGKEAAETS